MAFEQWRIFIVPHLAFFSVLSDGSLPRQAAKKVEEFLNLDLNVIEVIQICFL